MLRFLSSFFLTLALWPALVQAGGYVFDAETEPAAQQVFSSVSSPFCPGRMLRDCPSSGASELKNEVRLLLSQGNTASEVVSLLYERYGDEIRAVPDDSLFGRLAWAVPPLFLMLGAGIIFLWLYSKKKQGVRLVSEAAGESPATIDRELKAQIEEELKRF